MVPARSERPKLTAFEALRAPNATPASTYGSIGSPDSADSAERRDAYFVARDYANQGRGRNGRSQERITSLRNVFASPSLLLENSGSVARDHLASERTFLAYVRTSLALASAGVGK